jgi:hypothetical protein
VKHWWGKTLKWSRTLHIYLTLIALVTLLFFAATGFMMNHAEWFENKTPRTSTDTVTIPQALLKGDSLGIVEYLRKYEHAAGEAKVESGDMEIQVTFRSPGSSVDVRVNKETGYSEIVREYTGVYGVLSEMHRGKNTGDAWRLVIDITAVLVVLAIVTGFVMWTAMKKRRLYGILGLVLSTLAVAAIFFLAVR